MDTIRKKKLKLFGNHICEMLKTLVLGMVENERQTGRRARKWIDDILMWCDVMWCGQDIKGVMTMAEDRDKRKTFVVSHYGPC